MKTNTKLSAHIDSIAQLLHALIQDDSLFEDYVDFFFREFRVEELLRECGDNKRKGHKTVEILRYLVKLTFTNRSFSADLAEKGKDAPFSARAVYRMLQDERIDWLEFTTRLAKRVFDYIYDPSDDSEMIFIIDDSDFPRIYSNYCEGSSTQFSHTNMKNYTGYRLSMLALYWNGVVIPINAVPISSTDDEKILSPVKTGPITPAQKRRVRFLRSKSTEVIIEQLKMAQSVGFKARLVSFDSWYTQPKTVAAITDLGLDVIGMVRGRGNTYYKVNGFKNSIKDIYDFVKDNGGLVKLRNLHLQTIEFEDENGDMYFSIDADASTKTHQFPITLTYVRNRHVDREYFCLLSTQTGTDPIEVYEAYKKRWKIEQLFKDLKNDNLSLTGGGQLLSLAGISADIALVLLRYMVILSEREVENMRFSRSIQEQFFQTARETETVNTTRAFMGATRDAVMDLIENYDLPEEEALQRYSRKMAENDDFRKIVEKLPKTMRESILKDD